MPLDYKEEKFVENGITKIRYVYSFSPQKDTQPVYDATQDKVWQAIVEWLNSSQLGVISATDEPFVVYITQFLRRKAKNDFSQVARLLKKYYDKGMLKREWSQPYRDAWSGLRVVRCYEYSLVRD